MDGLGAYLGSVEHIENFEDLRLREAQTEAKLQNLNKQIIVQRREWEQANPEVFGINDIVKRNQLAQDVASAKMDGMPPSLRKNAEARNPFNRRENLPTILWGN